MSNVERDAPERTLCRAGAVAATTRESELLEPRDVPLGGPRAMLVKRTLPHRDRRMVGAWCFADHFGPTPVRSGAGMQVPPHPHIGLQTVTWLLQGEVMHRDSLGSAHSIRPGELNLMTAGRGIAHSERSSVEAEAVLRGLQLWVALPDEHRRVAPHFEHHAELPVFLADGGMGPGGLCTVIMGEIAGVVSPARAYTPLVAADLAVESDGSMTLPLAPGFEHAVLPLSDALHVEGRPVPEGAMVYLGPGRQEVTVRAAGGAAGRALLLGGTPFEEDLVMWWNFVGRSHDDIVEARTAWESGRGHESPEPFGVVAGDGGAPLPAPALPNGRLRARGRTTRPPES